MLLDLSYNRQRAVDYARRWALLRNPLFFDFSGSGGNCTNFVSQCIFAGAPVMNYTPTFGWYYISAEDRAPAWSGVNELYRFLTSAEDFAYASMGYGPYAVDALQERLIEPGDVIQLADENGRFYHTVIVSALSDGEIFVCAQSNDAKDRPLSSYSFAALRALHIMGSRIYLDDLARFEGIYNATSLPASNCFEPPEDEVLSE